MTNQHLQGKVAIVTGGASGIGLGTVERFVEEGAKVIIADLDAEHGEHLAKTLGDAVAFHKTDVANKADVQQVVDFAVSHFGGLHVMFNNAGIGGVSSRGRFFEADLDEFQRIMNTNLYGVMIGSQCAARHMAKNGGGSIINTASIAGLMPSPGTIIYSSGKAAVIHFSRSIAIDLGEFGIRVNCICPGHIPTAINATSYDMAWVVKTTQPLQRQGTVVDVAAVVLYFASDESAQVTGQVIAIDGGTTAGPPPSARTLAPSPG